MYLTTTSSTRHIGHFNSQVKRCTIVCTASPLAQPSNLHQATQKTLRPVIRPATKEDYWPIASVHCSAFYPRANDFWSPLLRLDRVVSLQIGREREDIHQHGRFECLVALAHTEVSQPTTLSTPSLGFVVDFLIKQFLPPSMMENYAIDHQTSGIAGAVVIDTLCEHVPPKRKIVNGGMIREVPRQGVAYLSNLAVSPAARRQGIALELVRRAEEQASEWGCKTMALHVDPTNTAAVELYRTSGYRFVSRQPEWQRFLEGRSNPLILMMRRLQSS